MVSIPEKTLEHWASIYLTYRYRSHAALWWPAFGEDVRIDSLPSGAGKAIQLELKTTTLSSNSHVHDVFIDLRQLDDYLAKPDHLQPFYIFPVPHWDNTLELAATAAGLPVSECGFRRSNSYTPQKWWFANWVAAMTTKTVAKILSSQLSIYRAGGAGRTSLVKFDFKTGFCVTTWADSNSHQTIPWQSLWTKLDSCGHEDWPQIVRLPAHLVPSKGLISHGEIRGILAEARDSVGEMVTLGSTGKGTFKVVEEPDVQRKNMTSDEEQVSYRTAVFLSTNALELD